MLSKNPSIQEIWYLNVVYASVAISRRLLKVIRLLCAGLMEGRTVKQQ